MEILWDIALILHFIGLAAIIGGFLVQTRSASKVVHPAMLHGALTQLVTGLILVGLLEMGVGDEPVLHMKVGVKLAIALVVTVLAWRYRKDRSVPTWVWGAIGGLAALNVVVAVVWG